MKLSDYVEMLINTNEESLAKIKELEQEGKYNTHLSTGSAPVIPVDSKYEYLPHGFFAKTKSGVCKILFVNPFCRIANKRLRTIVNGKENIKGIKGAIIVSNHVNCLDCTALKKAFGNSNIYFTAAEFNNMQGFLGDMMRIGGMLPLGLGSTSTLRNFNKAIKELLQKGKYVTFFPEMAEWWCYEKPRPMFDGAFKYAHTNNVPIIPVFFTFNETEESKKSPTGLKQFVCNILKPIYLDDSLKEKECIHEAKKKVREEWQSCYEEFYNRKLEDMELDGKK